MKTTGCPVGRTGARLAASLFLLLPGLLVPSLDAAEVYDGEHLTTGQLLHAQDGWHIQPGFGEIEVVSGAVPDNTTIVLRHRHRIPTDLPAFATRVNDARFNFVAFSGTETNAIIQFEATGEHVALLALGSDINGDGLLTADLGELGPAFGVFGRKFRIQEANLGEAHDDNFNIGGGDANSGNDYYRLQLRMDFTANDGDGLGTLAFMNLTDNDTGFHTVPGVRNQRLGLHRLPAAARPARWNALWVQLLSNGNSVPVADNFIPNLKGIQIIELAPVGDDWTLRWRGGVGPYQVQRQTDWGTGNWENVGAPTPLLSAPVDVRSVNGFFRVTQP